MARDGSGNYTLPLPDVITGTTIESSWANTTLDDIETAVTDSLSRSGSGGMLASLKLVDGTAANPGLAWNNEANTGFYRQTANEVRFSVGGSDVMRWTATGVQLFEDATWKSLITYPTGVTDNETLRYDTATTEWVANPNFTVTSAGVASLGTKLTLANTTLVTDDEFFIDAADSKTPRIWWGQYEQGGTPHLAQKFDRQNGIFYVYSNETTGAFTRYFMSGDTLYHDVSSVVIQEVGASNWDGYIGNGDTRGKFIMRAGASADTSSIEIIGQNQATTPGVINLRAPKDINLFGSADIATTDATISLQSDNITLSANTNDVGIYITTGSREIVIDNQFKFIGVPSSDPAVNTALFQDSGVVRISDGSAATDTVAMQEDGTFTPTIMDSTLSASEGQTYNAQVGHYTRTGKLVWFNLIINVSGLGTLNTTQGVRIGGLPFASSSTTGAGQGTFPCYATGLSATAGQTIQANLIAAGDQHFELVWWDATSGCTPVLFTDLGTGSLPWYFQVTGTYRTD